MRPGHVIPAHLQVQQVRKSPPASLCDTRGLRSMPARLANTSTPKLFIARANSRYACRLSHKQTNVENVAVIFIVG